VVVDDLDAIDVENDVVGFHVLPCSTNRQACSASLAIGGSGEPPAGFARAWGAHKPGLADHDWQS